jgi:hypothetical protein
MRPPFPVADFAHGRDREKSPIVIPLRIIAFAHGAEIASTGAARQTVTSGF